MKLNNKGFSLIELLGVIVLLGIISGIIGISYANLDKKIDEAYYINLSESILLSGNNYFNYKRINIAVGETIKVNIKTLIDEKYIDEVDNIKDICNLEKSYVFGYRVSYDKLDYYVCLVCDDYISRDNRCFK